MMLALDLGTKTGWARRDEAGRVTSGTLDLGKLAKKRGVTRYRVLLDFLMGYGGGPRLIPGDLVAFEDVAFMVSVRQAHVYGGLRAIVETAACDTGAVCVPVPVATIKKHATGSGKADKAAMIRAARRAGHEPKDDNEADALALLDYAATHKLVERD